MENKAEKLGDFVKKVDSHKKGMIFTLAIGAIAIVWKAIDAIKGLDNDGAKEPAKA